MSNRDPRGRQLSLRPEALDWVDVEGEIVVLDTERSVYLGLNPEGVALWRMLAMGTTQQELESGLVNTFGITPARAESDVEAFLGRLTELGLLVRHDG